MTNQFTHKHSWPADKARIVDNLAGKPCYSSTSPTALMEGKPLIR